MHAPLSPAFRSEWCSRCSARIHRDEWRALAARALEPNVFYEPAFALAAAPVFGVDAGAVLVRTATGQLAGLFPARIERWRGGLSAMLVGWTHPFAPLGTPLVDRDEPEAVIAAWLDHLSHDPAMPAQLLLPLVPEHGAFAHALDAVLADDNRANAAVGFHERALLAPGAQREGYLDRAMSAGKRKELRRQRRRLEDIAPISFKTAIGAPDIEGRTQGFPGAGGERLEGPRRHRHRQQPGDPGISCRRRLSDSPPKATRGSTGCSSTAPPSPPP
jgi:CelD/BcsL family acetyltransferase involved in cellulose biosynthesis